MPRSTSVPAYRLHKNSGQAIVTIRLASGKRHDEYLGEYNSPESRKQYSRVIAELAASPIPKSLLETGALASRITLNEVLKGFMAYAATHYRHPDGTATSEIKELKASLAPARELYGLTLAAEFGPRSLAAVRLKMIDARLCRTLINRRVERIRRVFKWATSEELIPVAVYQALRSLVGLKSGRTNAEESTPVEPVDAARVTATIPHMPVQVRFMVLLRDLTGMRPGEVRHMTLAEIDRTSKPWLYCPARHKTAHRGKTRTIPFGPRAQAVVITFLANHKVDPDLPMFSPAQERSERYAAMRAVRKSKVQPSQESRKKLNPKRKPATMYSANAYACAIARSCEKADVPHWHPNQLRHAFATKVRSLHGLEAAGAALGHAKMSATEVYAERDQSLAAKIANDMG